MAASRKYRKGKRVMIVILFCVIAFSPYVDIVNRNSKQMTYRQKVLKAIYPLWMWWTKTTGKHTDRITGHQPPVVSFYSLKTTLNNGETLELKSLEGKKVLIVNTASECGYTDQYGDLQKLHLSYGEQLVIIGFPANDFKHQEPGTDKEIAEFCKANYGVTVLLAEKSSVLVNDQQHPVYRWLTDPAQNGWNSKAPSWNFSKYLVSEKGVLVNYFGPSVSPLDKQLKNAIGHK